MSPPSLGLGIAHLKRNSSSPQMRPPPTGALSLETKRHIMLDSRSCSLEGLQCSAHPPLQPLIYCGLCPEWTPLPPLFLYSSLSMVHPPAPSANASTLAFAAAFSVFSWTLNVPLLLFSRVTLLLHRLSVTLSSTLLLNLYNNPRGVGINYHALFHR